MALTKALGGAGAGSSLTVKDEGTTLSSAVTSIDFVGAGVAATGTTAVTVTIPGATPAEVLITETVLGASASSITFSSIAATYRDLRVVIRGRGTKAATFAEVYMRFNGDTGSNYDWELSQASGTSHTASQGVGVAQCVVGHVTGSTAPANVSAATEVRVYDYRGTTFQKTILTSDNLKLANSAGNLFISRYAGWWRSTSAITSITVLPDSGSFDVGTVASLYGIL